MNVCKEHGKKDCEECWPGGWTLGWDSAVNRLEEHTKPGSRTWFDARDRSALRYLLAKMERR